MFNEAQAAFLKQHMTEQQFTGLTVIAGTGDLKSVAAYLTGTRLSPADQAMVVEDLKTKVPAKPAGYPTGGQPPSAFAGTVAVVTAPGNIVQRIASLLTVTTKGGLVIAKGLAKPYRDNPASWPTVDGFGRPFPTLEAIANMTKTDASRHITGSGWPKMVMDGISYFITDKAGPSLTVLNQVAQQELVSGVKVDPATIPADIKAGDWRWWNERRNIAARYDVPARHREICALSGIVPVEYETLMSSRQPATTAPTAPAAQRRRRSAA